MMILLFVLLVSVLVIVPQVYAFGFSDIASVFSLIVDPVFSVFGVAGTSPVITTAYLDKQKYMPGEQMTVTAAVEGAESVRAYIENDAGVDEVDMILITGNKEKGTWQCVWVLHDTVGDKEYKTRVAAISSGGLEVEKVLIWFDPNPGHSADEVGSGTMTGPIGIDGNLNVNEKVNAAEYCDENGENCLNASEGWDLGGPKQYDFYDESLEVSCVSENSNTGYVDKVVLTFDTSAIQGPITAVAITATADFSGGSDSYGHMRLTLDGGNIETISAKDCYRCFSPRILSYEIPTISKGAHTVKIQYQKDSVSGAGRAACIQNAKLSVVVIEGYDVGSGVWNESGSDIYYDGGNVGIGTTSPGQKLTVTGTVESTSGGFKFPDGSVQASAAGSGASAISGSSIYSCVTKSQGVSCQGYCETIGLNCISATYILDNRCDRTGRPISCTTRPSAVIDYRLACYCI